MLNQMLQRRILSNKAVAQFCSAAFAFVGAMVLLLGFRRLEHMDLTEAQLYSASIDTLLLTAAFVGLALFFSRWRKVE